MELPKPARMRKNAFLPFPFFFIQIGTTIHAAIESGTDNSTKTVYMVGIFGLFFSWLHVEGNMGLGTEALFEAVLDGGGAVMGFV